MSSHPCCAPIRPAPALAARRRGLGLGCLLWAAAGSALAQVAATRDVDREIALPARHGVAALSPSAARHRAVVPVAPPVRLVGLAAAAPVDPAASGLVAADRAEPIAPAWRAASPSLGLERGALALQLESGVKLSLRLRRGSASLNLRSEF